MQASDTGQPELDRADALYCFPDEPLTAEQLRHLLAHGTSERRAWAVSHLLRYADWDDIWTFVSRDDVRALFPRLDLTERMRNAWARILKIDPVSAPRR
jgi:hypothetical protein